MLCGNCGQKPGEKRYRYLCVACYYYQLRHDGKPRPKKLYLKHKRPRWCRTCGSIKPIINGYCVACYYYQLRHDGKPRPRHLWDDESVCLTCGKPLHTTGGIMGYCKKCYGYQAYYPGKPRPRHLWRIGPLGWCDCGEPAVTEIAEMKLCRQCADLEKS